MWCRASEFRLRVAWGRISSAVLAQVMAWARSFQPSMKVRIEVTVLLRVEVSAADGLAGRGAPTNPDPTRINGAIPVAVVGYSVRFGGGHQRPHMPSDCGDALPGMVATGVRTLLQSAGSGYDPQAAHPV